jgi:hypothetical protein
MTLLLLLSLIVVVVVVVAAAGFVIGHCSFESTGKQTTAEF